MKTIALLITMILLCGCIRDRGFDHANLQIKSGHVSVTAYDSGELLACYWPDGKTGFDCESLQLDLGKNGQETKGMIINGERVQPEREQS